MPKCSQSCKIRWCDYWRQLIGVANKPGVLKKPAKDEIELLLDWAAVLANPIACWQQMLPGRHWNPIPHKPVRQGPIGRTPPGHVEPDSKQKCLRLAKVKSYVLPLSPGVFPWQQTPVPVQVNPAPQRPPTPFTPPIHGPSDCEPSGQVLPTKIFRQNEYKYWTINNNNKNQQRD